MKNKFLILILAVASFSVFSLPAFSQSGATPTPTVTATPAPTVTATPAAASTVTGDVNKATDGVNWLTAMLANNSGILATVLGLLYGLSKAVSTSKSVPIVSWVQAFFDAAAGLLTGLGALLKKISDVLASILASDGIGGKS
jgi:hypothetical protein